jgi:putative ABC transport system substrate-binding protein
MKKMEKARGRKKMGALPVVLAVWLLAAAGGCGQPQQQQAPAQNAGGDVEAVYTIGVMQSVDHPALTAAYEGFVSALAENGYKSGEKVEFDQQSAQGDMSNLSTIGDRFVSRNVDMVLAITTDAAQTIAGKTTEIPILGTAITSYTVAGLIDSDEKPGGNITGTSDMNPVAAQVDLIRELVPDVAVIGLIYNSSEDNSVLQADIAKAQIEASGLTWQEATVTNSNEIQQAMQSLVTKCQAIYIPTDNTVASAMATVNSVAGEAGVPTICGESSMVMEGGLATMGINYFDLGYKTGLMAIEVINGKNPGDMPIQYADKSDEVTINGLVAEELGFTVPDKYKDAVIMPQ